MMSIFLIIAGLIGMSLAVDPSEERFPTIKGQYYFMACR
jgi:hypothetical protein